MFDFLLHSDALSAIFAFALVLIPAIIIHELGHFLAAKAVGITVLEFGIGFPPRMVTLFRRGATEYTLNWLPIGGFVRPLGEDFVKPVSAEAIEKDKQALKERLSDKSDEPGDPLHSEWAALRARGVEKLQTVNETPPLGRILFMSAGAIANLITGFVIFTMIALSGLPTIIGGSVGVAAVDPDSALGRAGVQQNDLIETINGEYFANSEAFFARLNELAGQPVTLTVQRAGEVFELNLTAEDTAAAATAEQVYVFVSSVADDSPASGAGILPEDLIMAFNGEPFSAFEELPERTQANAGKEVTLTLLRNGETLDVTLVPRENPPANQGAIGIGIMPAFYSSGVYYVEGAPQQSLVALPLDEAVRYSVERIGFFIREFIRLPAELISGALSSEEARLVSPLGMSQIGAVFLQESIQQNQPAIILNYIAIISILLGLTQLLPLPMLDGGRIVFVLVEMVRGRPIAPEREGLVHLIGMAFLLSLMVLTLLNDILNPITSMIP